MRGTAVFVAIVFVALLALLLVGNIMDSSADLADAQTMRSMAVTNQMNQTVLTVLIGFSLVGAIVLGGIVVYVVNKVRAIFNRSAGAGPLITLGGPQRLSGPYAASPCRRLPSGHRPRYMPNDQTGYLPAPQRRGSMVTYGGPSSEPPVVLQQTRPEPQYGSSVYDAGDWETRMTAFDQFAGPPGAAGSQGNQPPPNDGDW